MPDLVYHILLRQERNRFRNNRVTISLHFENFMICYLRNSVHRLTAFFLKEDDDMKHRRLICFLAAFALAVCSCASAFALQASTLSMGSRGEDVRKLQQALIDLGYLKGRADGIFGKLTYQAVCNFQTAKKLTVDGLAGKKTQSVLYDTASAAKPDTTAKTDASPAQDNSSSAAASGTSAASSAASSSGSVSSGNLFSGNYATLRLQDRGDRVKIMQQALIRLNYL